jgi:uncharacterized membrane protein YfcA
VGTGTVIAIVAIGAVVGFLGGLFGKGGSAMATPLLSLAGLPALVALASPLPAAIPGALVASCAYWRERRHDRQVVVWSIAVGVPATALGAYATRWTGGGALVVVTELVLVALGARLLLHPGEPDERPTRPRGYRARLALVAALVGGVSGLLANGGGFLLAPLYVLVLRLPIKQAFACSLMVATALAIPGTIVHTALGHVDWQVVGLFALASVPLSYTGARVALSTEAPRLERVYGVALVAVGVGTLAFSV